MTTAYTTGQITLTNGSAVVTGVGTAWLLALIAGGQLAPEAAGNMLPILSVDSDTQITAATKWIGATGTYSYALIRDSAYLQQLTANSNALAQLIAELAAGTIFKFDASGDLAGRATYDDRPKGFSYLVIIGVTQPQLHVKASAASGDWAGPFAYGTGPQGPVGNTGLVTWRGAYGGATAYAKNDGVYDQGASWIALQSTTGHAPPTLPTLSNAYWSLMAMKGADGSGDMTGPGAGVADGNFAAFNGTTGKIVKEATVPAATFLGRRTAGIGAVERLTQAQARGLMQVDILGGFRNKLINFDFLLCQRLAAPATGQSIAAGASAYVLDRWLVTNNTNQTVLISQQLQTLGQTAVPGNPKYKLRAVFASAPTSGTLRIAQRIEGVEIFAGLAASARGHFSGPSGAEALACELVQNFGTGGSPSSSVTTAAASLDIATINDASTQVRKAQFNVPAVTTKTLGSNSNDFVELAWVLTPRQAGSYDLSRMSFVEGDASQEVDPSAPRHPQQEMALCQRYCCRMKHSLVATGVSLPAYGYNFPVPMRATPTVSTVSGGSTNSASIQAIAGDVDNRGAYFQINATATNAYVLNAIGGYDAEL
ncbi:hypothetical protein QO004_000072 [Rhizobium mesoamericanum]|uniref:hypothetical protein n=1 Tax=Rhizobium mesoamericanum TaxID=1079800 RepID=UPI002788952E|nr:hypothetical protein [Rhizobium mesoamericanum]MDQ0558299.1 hypothetical protein [Rhizobium mesoamericanum]